MPLPPSNPSIWLVIAAVYAGLLASTAVLGTIVYDLLALRFGWRTVSQELHALSQTVPLLAALIIGWLSFALGVLVGHLFFPLENP